MSEEANKSNDTMMEVEVVATSANNEFMVHSSHTCDGCHASPIIGKRFKASDIANYDLCAKCFAAYNGEELFEETLLARDRKSAKDYVLKLRTNDCSEVFQVRRIYVADVWGDHELSYSKLISAASKFASRDGDVDVDKAKVTYIDGDGDKITLSSDGELTDSFRQTFATKPRSPFRLTVIFPMGNNAVKAPPAKLTHIEKKIARKSDQLEALKLKAKLASASAPNQNDKQKPMGWINEQNFDSNFFIHARHTCDGCSRTPIIGTRYRATKIPDFDLCAKCYKKYEGEDLDFKPEVLDRDRNMQQRWLSRQLSNSRMCEIHASPPCEGLTRPSKKVKAEGQAREFGGRFEDTMNFLRTLSPAVKGVKIYVSPPCQKFSEVKPKSEQHASKEPAEAVSEPDSKERSNETDPKQGSSDSNDSFFSDADGNSIAEVIGRTLDVCVQAMEDVMIDVETKKPSTDVASAATAAAAEALSVASSLVDELMNSDSFTTVNASSHTDAAVVNEPKVEEPNTSSCNAEDDWSVVDDEKDGRKEKEAQEEETKQSLTSVEPISPVVLAKWDTELKQLHELGFLDDFVNTNALEQIEASYLGCGLDEPVTVNAAVEHILMM